MLLVSNTANSSKLELTMISEPIYMQLHVSLPFGLLQKNGSDYPKPSSELGCQKCPLDYDYNYLLSSQEFQIDSSCKIYPR